MNRNEIIFTLSLFTLILIIGSIYAMLHNIDLSWNAKFIDLVDCNGIICADVTQMYNMSMLKLVFMIPLLCINSFICAFYFIESRTR